MRINDIKILELSTKLFPCLDFNHMNYMPFIDQKIQWWARPFYAFWDWDRDFWKLVSKFETETETLEISLKFWDWDWDFMRLVSKLETETETTLVSVSVSRPKSRSSLPNLAPWNFFKKIEILIIFQQNVATVGLVAVMVMQRWARLWSRDWDWDQGGLSLGLKLWDQKDKVSVSVSKFETDLKSLSLSLKFWD